MPNLEVPMLALLGLIPEEMGSATTPEKVRPYLPLDARVEAFDDTGHFIHIEKPHAVAERVLGFFA
jgi:pimeloyl-ACP methyl ester carboxylesterase